MGEKKWLRKPLYQFLEARSSHWHIHYSLLQGSVPPGCSWKVEGLSVLLDSQGALCGLLALRAVSLLSVIQSSAALWQRKGRSHHSMLRWASSCLNRSIQVSWIVSWKAYRRRGVPVFIWKLWLREPLKTSLIHFGAHVAVGVCCFPWWTILLLL